MLVDVLFWSMYLSVDDVVDSIVAVVQVMPLLLKHVSIADVCHCSEMLVALKIHSCQVTLCKDTLLLVGF